MKGSLHTDELMKAVTSSASGLRTERRISHVFIMDVPGHRETLFVTDAAINIFPDLDTKRDIIQNAIDLWIGIGMGTPKVAILSAVETVTTKIPSTIEAAALCKMADRGQITGGLLDGPLGARVPIILTSRADSVRTRLASCAVAAIYANARRGMVAVPAA
jgi:phosphate acetyltransferase